MPFIESIVNTINKGRKIKRFTFCMQQILYIKDINIKEETKKGDVYCKHLTPPFQGREGE